VAIGAVVGSLLGALSLWILLMVWLKKRKKAHRFKQSEHLGNRGPSIESNGMTPFILPPPVIYNPVHPDSKRRIMQEIERPVSPVTSIADTGTDTHSELHAAFMTETISEDPYSVASSPDPFREPSGSHKDAKGL
jgi:hypothetical protein